MKHTLKPSNKIFVLYVVFAILLLLVYRNRLAPIIFISPPKIISEFNNYFLLFSILTTIVVLIFIKVSYKDIDMCEISNKDNTAIRNKCFYLPYIFYVSQIIITFILLLIIGVTIITTDSFASAFRMFIACFSFQIILASVLLIISRWAIKDILLSIVSTSNFRKINLSIKILFQLVPVFLALILIIFAQGYYTMITNKADFFAEFAYYQINNYFPHHTFNNITEAEEKLSKIKIADMNFSYFIICPDKSIKGKLDKKSQFYIDNFSTNYRFYGPTIEEQGVFFKSNGYTLGVIYIIDTHESIYSFISSFIIFFIFCFIISIYFSTQISYDIRIVTKRMNELASGKLDDIDKKLPISSNDEIGSLVLAFNQIQELERKNIFDLKNSYDELNGLNEEMTAINEELNETLEKLKETQNQLIESEKLAFLGHIMGGIAHSLKTPLTACFGALKIIHEKNTEINNTVKNNMSLQTIIECTDAITLWKERIEQYVIYMNNVIKTVRSYASSDTSNSFCINEIVNSVNILMESSLKSNNCKLITSVKTDEFKKYTGEPNPLIQVINNLIDNSIQSYTNKTKTNNIELNFYEYENNLIICVNDYGSGIKENIRDKLFNDFITTKGKEGTGLGLYFSKRVISAKFNGDISFRSHQSGTEFYIKIPII